MLSDEANELIKSIKENPEITEDDIKKHLEDISKLSDDEQNEVLKALVSRINDTSLENKITTDCKKDLYDKFKTDDEKRNIIIKIDELAAEKKKLLEEVKRKQTLIEGAISKTQKDNQTYKDLQKNYDKLNDMNENVSLDFLYALCDDYSLIIRIFIKKTPLGNKYIRARELLEKVKNESSNEKFYMDERKELEDAYDERNDARIEECIANCEKIIAEINAQYQQDNGNADSTPSDNDTSTDDNSKDTGLGSDSSGLGSSTPGDSDGSLSNGGSLENSDEINKKLFEETEKFLKYLHENIDLKVYEKLNKEDKKKYIEFWFEQFDKNNNMEYIKAFNKKDELIDFSLISIEKQVVARNALHMAEVELTDKEKKNIHNNEVKKKVAKIIQECDKEKILNEEAYKEIQVAIENELARKYQQKAKKAKAVKKDSKLLAKCGYGALGFATGFGLSFINMSTGIHTITIAISLAKLSVSAAKAIAKPIAKKIETKFPDSKIVQMSKKLDTKFNELKEKNKLIATAVKINEFLKSPKVQWFVNGVSAGYLVGNLYQMVDNMMRTASNTVNNGVTNNTGNQTGTMVEDTIENNYGPEIDETVGNNVGTGVEEVIGNNTGDAFEQATQVLNPTQGETFDISGINKGLVSSESNDYLNLITSAGKDATFDKAVTLTDGTEMWHFKQANGKGYAWFKADDVRAFLEQTAGKGRGM